MWQHIMYLCVCCFQCREVCTSNTSLHWKQRTHKYVICCHIAHNKEILIITSITRDFSEEQYVLLEDDTRYAIEACRSNLRVLV